MKLLPALLCSSSRRSAKDSGCRQMGREEEERQWEGKEEEEAGPAAVEMQRGGGVPQECSSTRVGSHFAERVAVAAGAATVAFRYSFCRCRSGCSACWRRSYRVAIANFSIPITIFSPLISRITNRSGSRN
jgi:hypothetical protein